MPRRCCRPRVRERVRDIIRGRAAAAPARRWALLLLLLPALAALGPGPSWAQSPPEPGAGGPEADVSGQQTLAFVGVDVIPMDGSGVLEDHTVVVRGDRIVGVGPADRVELAEGARVVAEGGWLLPGLGEMHSHIPPQGGREWMEQVLFLYLANGVTTARGMLGQPEHLELREDVAAGRTLGPRIYTSGPSINGNSIPGPDSARRAVRHQAAAGYDFLKIHPGLTRREYDALVEEANQVGIRWAGHVSLEVGLHRALETGQATIDHLDRYVEAMVPDGDDLTPQEVGFFGYGVIDRVVRSRIPELARATARAGVWNVPTQSLIERILSPRSPEEMAAEPEVRYMPRQVVENWKRAKAQFDSDPRNTPERREAFIQLRRDLIAALHEAGARLLLGSDAPQIFQVPGFSAHDELRILVEAGLTPREALATGTRNVAAFFGDGEEYGTVTEGKVADLLLLGADPLEDIRNTREIRGVMLRGRWLPASEIRERLEALATERGASGDQGG